MTGARERESSDMANTITDRADGSPSDLSYARALDELDQILDELESSAVDVDTLADRVARGAELVRFCRERLHTVRADVEDVVESLLDDAAGATHDEPAPSRPGSGAEGNGSDA